MQACRNRKEEGLVIEVLVVPVVFLNEYFEQDLEREEGVEEAAKCSATGPPIVTSRYQHH